MYAGSKGQFTTVAHIAQGNAGYDGKMAVCCVAASVHADPCRPLESPMNKRELDCGAIKEGGLGKSWHQEALWDKGELVGAM